MVCIRVRQNCPHCGISLAKSPFYEHIIVKCSKQDDSHSPFEIPSDDEPLMECVCVWVIFRYNDSKNQAVAEELNQQMQESAFEPQTIKSKTDFSLIHTLPKEWFIGTMSPAASATKIVHPVDSKREKCRSEGFWTRTEWVKKETMKKEPKPDIARGGDPSICVA